MKRHLLIGVAILLCGPGTAPAQASLDDSVRAFIARHHIPSAAIAVVKNGVIVKSAGYGIANLEWGTPATDSTVYEIGSISKQFAAEATMLLVQDGKLALDVPIQRYVSGLPAAWSAITARHIMTHTSGLHDWESAGEFSYRREYTPAEFVQLVAKFPLDFAPGDRFAYTNSGPPLLGLIVEALTGVKYEQFVRDRIFIPAGMTATRFKHPEEIVPRRAGGYVDQKDGLENGEPQRPGIIAPSGGVMSTARDMAKWDVALTNGVILKHATVELMMQPVTLNDGKTFSAGMGWFFDAIRGHRRALHNGSTVAGFSSVVYRYPEDALGVVVLFNVDRGNAVNLLATKVASYYVPGVWAGGVPEGPDPDPALSQRLLALLADIADDRDSELLAPSLRNPGGPPRTNRIYGYKGRVDRFAFIDREDLGAAGIPRFGNTIRWIYRYRLAAGARNVYYTFELTPQGKVARTLVEED